MLIIMHFNFFQAKHNNRSENELGRNSSPVPRLVCCYRYCPEEKSKRENGSRNESVRKRH